VLINIQSEGRPEWLTGSDRSDISHQFDFQMPDSLGVGLDAGHWQHGDTEKQNNQCKKVS
jgi:hypothetical protein